MAQGRPREQAGGSGHCHHSGGSPSVADVTGCGQGRVIVGNDRRADTFSDRVVLLFATQIFGAGLGIINGILLARLLGPALKGDYYLLILVPSTAVVLLQLGLPAAISYFAARGRTAGLVVKALVLTGALTLTALVVLWAILPLLEEVILHGIDSSLVLLAFLALPLALNSTLMAGIVMGRQAVRWYAAVNTLYPIVTTALLVLVLGGLGALLLGALAVYLVTLAVQSVGLAIGARRAARANPEPGTVSYREIFRYGLPIYPGSLTNFFSYRIDAYMIAVIIPEPSEPLGFYSMAVGLAEMVFFFPNAVSTLFFPHIASLPREDADRQVPMVARVTLLITTGVALVMIPAAIGMILILLPAFEASIAPFLILLPGVVSLSVAKVVGGYMAGIGRPGINSSVAIAAFAVNVVMNLLLIPPFGIVGASAASLVSYSFNAFLITAIAARVTGASVISFWIPRPADVRFTLAATAGLLGRVRGRLSAASGRVSS